ncbi:MAG TPA: alpha/beta hydrolase [Actinomycetota bacterium]|jgi:pimeloyl-ACP methyl ester carboxylesterase|nr:alpha/beta hydrolase [Actinomycetota bacterium]
MTPEPTPVELPDGRSVDVYVDGPPDGVPLVSHHGTPGAGLPYGPFVRAAAERGMRWVSYSRPGYASSTRVEGRSVADCVADVVAIVDSLGAGRFYTTGGSGGGPHTLACAALLPDRVLACAAIASVAPRDASGLDWTDGMGPENIEEFGAAEEGPNALERFLEPEAQGLREANSAQELIDTMAGLLPPVDRGALSGAYAEATIESMHRSVRSGIWGWFDDDMAFLKDWGFSVDAIEVPVAVWQGRHDQMVPFGHGAWLAEHTAGARPHLLVDHGHLSIAVSSYDRVLDDLLEMEKERA